MVISESTLIGKDSKERMEPMKQARYQMASMSNNQDLKIWDFICEDIITIYLIFVFINCNPW